MPASIPTIDRRSIPSVAIIGNDAVLVAAPATPVQLSHACLRYGFSVAVPASWGDELVAAEALRQLASRNKGPAVMCVCPYARSRLLAPGPDLEPFLVSLVSPPVATARYLRSIYGDHGVHLTYIGSCPSGADPVFDARLTPDAFIADLAERGIALSEQPLVFDSIVPPDRRRWCSLPGGVPSPETLASDVDTQTLVEIERDDVSTDLVQHIITREHVLLDLAPGLGCACSGAIGNLAPRAARAAVAALEPPRSLGPVIDLTVVVSLDVSEMPAAPAKTPNSPPTSVGESKHDLLERRLDEILGTQVSPAHIDREVGAELEAELDGTVADGIAVRGTVVDPFAPSTTTRGVESATADEPGADVSATAAEVSEHDRQAGTGPLEAPAYSVRRRTPPATPSRYSGTGVPKAMSTDGRPLPRAYVAKRRTPPTGMATIDEEPGHGAGEPPRADAGADADPPIDGEAPPVTTADAADDSPTSSTSARTENVSPVATMHNAVEFSATIADESPGTDDRAVSADPVIVPEPSTEPRGGAPPESGASPHPLTPDTGAAQATASGTVAAADPNQGVLRVLMFAVLLAFAVVVLYTLRP